MDLKILIADDSRDDRLFLKRYISRRGMNVEFLETETGLAAIEMMAAYDDIDCVFLDYSLPDQDGIQVLKSVYDYKLDLGPCPIIMLTGQGSESVAVDAIRCGAQDYMIKENLSYDSVHIARVKAMELFELKKSHNEAKRIIEHSQRMETVGQLSSGIAHDFNNLLTITFGNIQLLGGALDREEIDRDYCKTKLGVIEQTSRRGSDLVKQLMVFARQRALEAVTTNINDVIEGLLEFLQRSLGEHIEIYLDLAEDLYLVDVDPGQLEHALINMAVNARDVMEDGGVLSLLTEMLEISERDSVTTCLPLEPGSYVKVTVSDTGRGMKQEVADKIFEPFFTTKDVGKGTGLGLSTVYGFMQESGGTIEVASKLHEGTSFSMYFPKSAHEVEEYVSSTDDAADSVQGGDETILLVEDEDEIRMIASIVLQEAGYRVIEANCGQAALDVMQDQSMARDIDILFTDIAMPGEMNGIQMAARAQVLKPEMKLMFTTGYGDGAVPDMNLLDQYTVVHKPYQPDELLSRLRQVLDED